VELFSLQYPDARAHQLSIKDRIVLVFMKLKQDLSFAVLSVFFHNISVSTCRQIYITILLLLGAIFKNLIYWPSKDEIMSNIPFCFNNFSNVRVVLGLHWNTSSKAKMFVL